MLCNRNQPRNFKFPLYRLKISNVKVVISEQPNLDAQSWFMQPATNQQIKYIQVLLRQNGKDASWLYRECCLDLWQMYKLQASKAIEMLLHLPELEKMLRGEAEPSSPRDLEDEHWLCGFDDFGAKKPYRCADAEHTHATNCYNVKDELSVRQANIQSQNQNSKAFPAGTRNSECDNSIAEQQGTFCFPDAQ